MSNSDLENCVHVLYKINLILINISMILNMDFPLDKKYACKLSNLNFLLSIIIYIYYLFIYNIVCSFVCLFVFLNSMNIDTKIFLDDNNNLLKNLYNLFIKAKFNISSFEIIHDYYNKFTNSNVSDLLFSSSPTEFENYDIKNNDSFYKGK